MLLELPDWNCRVYYKFIYSDPKDYAEDYDIVEIHIGGEVYKDPSDVDPDLKKEIESELQYLLENESKEDEWDQDYDRSDEG